MLGKSEAFCGFSVNDTAVAKQFYTETLGLNVSEMRMPGDYVLLQLDFSGGGKALIYPKPNHVPATFTVLNFPVPDIAAAVGELTRRGVEFLRYDDFDQDEQGIARGEPRVAWFADPAGNVLSVIQER